MASHWKTLIAAVALTVLLHMNYQHGFVPEKDFWTVAEMVLVMIGVNIRDLPLRKPNDE